MSETGETRSSKFWVRSSENLERRTSNRRPSHPFRFSRKSRESRANNEIRFTGIENAAGEFFQ